MFPLGLPHDFLCPTHDIHLFQSRAAGLRPKLMHVMIHGSQHLHEKHLGQGEFDGAVWWLKERNKRCDGNVMQCLWSQKDLKVSTDRWSTHPVSLSRKCIARRVNASTIESSGWTNSMQTVIPGNTWQTCISVWTTNQGLFDFCWVGMDMIFVLKVIRMCLSGLTGLGNVSTAGNLGNLSVRADLFLGFTNCPRVNDNTY